MSNAVSILTLHEVHITEKEILLSFSRFGSCKHGLLIVVDLSGQTLFTDRVSTGLSFVICANIRTSQMGEASSLDG